MVGDPELRDRNALELLYAEFAVPALIGH